MKDINIEINVCDSTGKSTCIAHPPIQVNPHSCCHSGNGQEPGVSVVASVFGRTGVVTAQPGDYTADQITETATRKFATPDEKAVWNAKQDELISGTTIRTVFGQSLLGSGDLSLTPAQMGVAAVGHTHTTAEITDYTQKTKQLIHSSLEAGAGVTLSYNPASEKTIISAAGGGSGSGGSGYIVADRQGATAGQSHAFSIRPQSTFNLAAYALKEEVGAANQTYVADDFDASSKINYDTTNDVVFDGRLHEVNGVYSDVLEQSGSFYNSEIKNGYHSVDISVVNDSIVPNMTSDNIPAGYIASASSYNTAAYSAYYSFDGVSETNQKAWISNARPTEQAPQWLRIDLPNKLPVSGFAIFSRYIDSYGNTVASARDFILQGSDDNVDWHDLHKVTNDTRNDTRVIKSFKLDETAVYQHYRLLITGVNGIQNFVVIAELKLYPPESKFIMRYADGFYTIANGALSEITDAVTPELIEKIGVSAASLTGKYAQDVTIVSNKSALIKYVYKSQPQIVVQKSLLRATAWPQINSATLTATQTGNGKVRVAVTRDLVNWHVLRNGAWVDVGSLSADTAGATALIADGMTPTELGAITAAQWTQLFSSNNGVPDSLAFAFVLDITDPVADVATIDRLVLNVNDASSWKVQSPAEVEIRWRTDSVTFRTVTAGNYKLAYQVP
ncbi:discoidin domain-containing protein [Pectobacterium aroidearum]|uniref:discoidin domain-containing protein n=1 Tax=Pectobacterium aroidearum TaxID=1201031 RepID=UPI0032EE2986